MLTYTKRIRDIADRLLKNGSVDMVIGFRQGTIPMMNEPCFITKPKEVESLIWDSNCRANLANYLVDCKGKLAVLAKGCDSRNIVTHITENKIDRNQIYIIGIPCKGMVDKKKISTLISGDILTVDDENNGILVKTSDNSEIFLDKKNILQNNCITCSHKNPVISDELVGDSIEEKININTCPEIDTIEKMNYKDRCNYFDDIFSTCIRCYACKNACPLCYCPTCFIDESKPQWVGKGQDLIDIKIFHFLRAYHCAGRCTDCGACEQACPVGINMRILTQKLIKECKNQFNWEAGLSLDHRPALDVYNEEDPEKFIM